MKTEEGLDALRNYRYEFNEDRQEFTREPIHDWASHGSDAFRYLATAMKQDDEEKPKQKANVRKPRTGAHSWMS
ncbi:hypothetical protein D3C76_1768000 [compost metagenome]